MEDRILVSLSMFSLMGGRVVLLFAPTDMARLCLLIYRLEDMRLLSVDGTLMPSLMVVVDIHHGSVLPLLQSCIVASMPAASSFH
jgi:hypothetical protein